MLLRDPKDAASSTRYVVVPRGRLPVPGLRDRSKPRSGSFPPSRALGGVGRGDFLTRESKRLLLAAGAMAAGTAGSQTMTTSTWRRSVVGIALAGGCLFAGPCGITTLQFKDFLSSTLIRTGVTTLASVVEAAVIEAAQSPEATDDG